MGVIRHLTVHRSRIPAIRLPEKVRVTKSVLKSEQISCVVYKLAVKKLKGPTEAVSVVPVMEHQGSRATTPASRSRERRGIKWTSPKFLRNSSKSENNSKKRFKVWSDSLGDAASAVDVRQHGWPSKSAAVVRRAARTRVHSLSRSPRPNASLRSRDRKERSTHRVYSPRTVSDHNRIRFP